MQILEVLTGMPQKEFDMIAWVNKPSWEEFQRDVETIAFNILGGK